MLKRTVVGIGLLAVFALVWYFDGAVRMAAFAACAVISVHEMQSAFAQRGCRICVWPLYLFAAAFYPLGLYLGASCVWVLLGAAFLLMAGEQVLNPRRNAQEAVSGIFVLVYPLVGYAFLHFLAAMPNAALSRGALLLVFAGPLLGDTLAYFAGTLWGKRPLAPEISPKKTVEGSIAGLFGGALSGFLIYVAQPLYGGELPLFHLLLLGFALGGIGQVGDLFASGLKRYTGIKDYGRLFPGHGGVMDRLDSVLFCAPAVYLYFHLAQGGLGL